MQYTLVCRRRCLLTLPEEMRVLIVEDSRGHARLIEIALRDCGVTNEIAIADGGHAAIAELFHEDAASHCLRPGPALVMLDLNMPGMSGYDVLNQIRSANDCTRVIVIVVTSSADPSEEARCLERGANAFLHKPPEPDLLQQVFERLELVGE